MIDTNLDRTLFIFVFLIIIGSMFVFFFKSLADKQSEVIAMIENADSQKTIVYNKDIDKAVKLLD